MDFYDDINNQRQMVGDRVRTGTYRDSIAATVQPGEVVLDVGAGSGILSLFAAQAGARRVYAIERARQAADLARKLAAANGFADRIVVIEADAETATAVEPVDVVVSEWLGVYGVDENMLAPVLHARDRWLKPGGRMIPGVTSAWIAPAETPSGAAAIAFQEPAWGLDLSALAPFVPDEAVWLPRGAPPESLRAEPQSLWSTDPYEMDAAQARRPFAAELTFVVDGPVNGLIVWFSATMPGAAELTNRPGEPATHWGNFLFPIANATSAEPEDKLHVGFHCVPARRGGSHHLWSSTLNGGSMEIRDTRRVRRPPSEPPWRVDTTT